jgi:CspA family cold shock protein
MPEVEQGSSEKAVRLKGKVVWFDDGRGYGFILDLHSNTEIFCHHTQIQSEGFRTLGEGQLVEFELGKHHGKLQADKVIVITEQENNHGNA